MTSEELPPTARTAAPGLPEVAPAGTPGERARALLRLRPYRKLWTTQLLGGAADRLTLLVLVPLTVLAAVLGGQFGHGYRALALAVAAVFAARLLATGLVGAVLLGPVHALVGGKLDRRWSLLGADLARALLVGLAPWWAVWTPGSAIWPLLGTAFLAGAAERVWTIGKAAAVPGLLAVPEQPGPPSAAALDAVRTLDLRTGWAALPLAAAGLIGFTLLNNVLAALGLDWLRDHQLTVAALGTTALFVANAALLYFQELPAGATAAPRSPLQGLRAPVDALPSPTTTLAGDASRRPFARPSLKKGRTGSAPYFTFSIAAAYASMAGVTALGLLTAGEHLAGPIGYGLLVLAAAGTPALGIRLSRATLPGLSRRRLLALGLVTSGVALILAGLVLDFVLVLLFTVLAGLAAGVVIATGRGLLAQEIEEIRLGQVTGHLYAVLRAVVGAALVGMPLLAAAYGQVALGEVGRGSFTFIHDGAALAVSTAGLLTLALAAVVLLKTDDQRGVVPFGRELAQAVRGRAEIAPHRAAGQGYFIALEGGDGAGKSTQAQALAEWIRAKGHEVVLTREPGGSPIGQRLRALVLDVGNTGLSHRAEALIYAADRAEHVENVIRPALERGAVVLTDRYMDSSIAYQGAGRDLAATEVARISRWATGGLVPDLTVVLDVDPTAARERFTEALDRLESEPTEFHQRVRSGFLALAAADPARYLVVDGTQPAANVTTAIRHRLDRELPLSGQEKAAKAEQERKAREEAARRAAEAEAARKAAEEAERKRLALLEQLRAEQAEKDRLAAEEAARVQAEAARKAAEDARIAAEAESARRAREEAERRAAEAARAEAAEAAAREAAAEEAARAEFARQRELQREEQRRRAEEALQRAEDARRAAEAEAAAALAAEAPTAPTPAAPAPAAAPADETAVLPKVESDVETTRELPKPGTRGAGPKGSRPGSASGSGSGSGSGAGAGAAGRPAVDETAVLPKVGGVDETAVLPKVGGVEETAVLPVADPARQAPRALFRDEPDSAQTRELRPRPEWAEETPLDDLPSLTDSLLGSREEWARWEVAEPEPGQDEQQPKKGGWRRRKD
ncbi:dTMP kinase [Kitasatospora sp. NPDC088783]|uniref:dTMP kinase n=1 Tax=Kitasatospora sp. NPDC088783 TaxID=3364077 RepID=UPI003805F81C